MKLELRPRELRFRTPVHASYGTLERRELIEVVLRDLDGPPGRGEAAPLQPYDGVSLRRVREELEACAGPLAGLHGAPRGEVLDACRPHLTAPQALAAIDVALWDREGRRAGRPVCDLLSEEPRAAIPVTAALPGADVAAEAREAAGAGFQTVKVKVGLDDDATGVAAARAAVGSQVAIRLDANGAWSPDEAIASLDALAPIGIELCEEPVHGAEGLRAVRDAVGDRVPIAMDETARDPGAAASGATQYVCLKVAAAGGISRLMAAAAAAEAAGSAVYVGSTYDGPVGIAASLHAAAALGRTPACGLATLGLFDGLDDPLPVAGGEIAVPRGPGLGIA